MKLIHAPSSTSHPLFPRCAPLQPSFLSPLLLPSPAPFSNGNGTEPCWSSSARSELSSLKTIYGWSCRDFKVWPSRHREFFLVVESFWPQSQQLTTTRRGSLAIVIMHNGTKSSFSTLSVHPSPFLLHKSH